MRAGNARRPAPCHPAGRTGSIATGQRDPFPAAQFFVDPESPKEHRLGAVELAALCADHPDIGGRARLLLPDAHLPGNLELAFEQRLGAIRLAAHLMYLPQITDGAGFLIPAADFLRELELTPEHRLGAIQLAAHLMYLPQIAAGVGLSLLPAQLRPVTGRRSRASQ